jgi:hypothetical protein
MLIVYVYLQTSQDHNNDAWVKCFHNLSTSVPPFCEKYTTNFINH